MITTLRQLSRRCEPFKPNLNVRHNSGLFNYSNRYKPLFSEPPLSRAEREDPFFFTPTLHRDPRIETHNVDQLSQLKRFKKLNEMREGHALEMYMLTLKRPLTVPIYEEIMLYYLQNVKKEETKELLKEMKQHQLEPSSLIYNRALVSLASDIEAVEELLQEMKLKEHEPHFMSMNRIIEQLRGGGREKEEKAAKYFLQMREEGTINSGTYIIVGQLYQTGARRKVVEGLNELIERQKIILNKEDVKLMLKMEAADVSIEGWGDVEVYSLHFSNLLRAQRFQEVVDRYQEMTKELVIPDLASDLMLIEAYARLDEKDKALSMLNSLRIPKRPQRSVKSHLAHLSKALEEKGIEHPSVEKMKKLMSE